MSRKRRKRPQSKPEPPSGPAPTIDLEGLLCALVLAPNTFSRNRFFGLFEHAEPKRIRRRATRLRGIIRQIAGTDETPAGEIVGTQVLEDGRVLMRYRVDDIAYRRTTSLTALEAALVRYALSRGSDRPAATQDKALVDDAMARLAQEIGPFEAPVATEP